MSDIIREKEIEEISTKPDRPASSSAASTSSSATKPKKVKKAKKAKLVVSSDSSGSDFDDEPEALLDLRFEDLGTGANFENGRSKNKELQVCVSKATLRSS